MYLLFIKTSADPSKNYNKCFYRDKDVFPITLTESVLSVPQHFSAPHRGGNPCARAARVNAPIYLGALLLT